MAIVPGRTVAVAAAAITDIGQFPDRSSVGLAEEALDGALAQAGIRREDVDGFLWNMGAPFGANYDAVCAKLGIRPGFVMQARTHGRFTGPSLGIAAMAVLSGAATIVVCMGGIKGMPYRPEVDAGRRMGLDAFARPAATALQRYLEMYGADRDRLGDVVRTSRRYGALNPKAFLRSEMSAEDYLASPMLLPPLREVDCLPTDESVRPINDSGVCVVVTRADRLAPGAAPVYVAAAQGIQAGPEEVYFGRPGLGEPTFAFEPTRQDLAAFTEAGLQPSQMDGFYTYDAFSPTVWFALERFGYCPPGEGWTWATAERMWLDGELPVNTNGGILSAGHTAGWAQIVEMVGQLRGEAGPRQIPGARLLHWGSVFGDSVILTNDQECCAAAPSWLTNDNFDA